LLGLIAFKLLFRSVDVGVGAVMRLWRTCSRMSWHCYESVWIV